ncbi:hypothetical protein SAMN05216233_12866, partial [Desulfoluna spongiiphila]
MGEIIYIKSFSKVSIADMIYHIRDTANIKRYAWRPAGHRLHDSV